MFLCIKNCFFYARTFQKSIREPSHFNRETMITFWARIFDLTPTKRKNKKEKISVKRKKKKEKRSVERKKKKEKIIFYRFGVIVFSRSLCCDNYEM